MGYENAGGLSSFEDKIYMLYGYTHNILLLEAFEKSGILFEVKARGRFELQHIAHM